MQIAERVGLPVMRAIIELHCRVVRVAPTLWQVTNELLGQRWFGPTREAALDAAGRAELAWLDAKAAWSGSEC